jgi:glutamine cyclotransferase
MLSTNRERILGLMILLLVSGCWYINKHNNGSTKDVSYYIVNIFPHDSEAFTQGLAIDEGHFYEGTGLYGRSTLRRVEVNTGKILQIHRLPKNIFGEGITVYKDRIYQLSWKSEIGYIYNKTSFKLLETFSYSGEGWGLTHDGSHLIMSNGTNVLRFLDPETFQELRTVEVTDKMDPVERLNELEYVESMIFANVWQTNLVACINPVSGDVEDWLNMTGIEKHLDNNKNIDVLNGIAYDGKNLFITGKLWPNIFEIKLTRKE